MPKFEKGNPGKPKGAKNRFRKPRNISVSKSDHKRNTKGLRPPWKKGEVANPKGRPKGSGVKDIALAFNTLLGRARTKDERVKMIDELYYSLFSQAKHRGGQSAARTLLAWGIGMPKQMIQVSQGVEIDINVAPELEGMDLSAADNVTIDRGVGPEVGEGGRDEREKVRDSAQE